MDRAYLLWSAVFAVGALVGLFLSPQVVGIVVGGLLFVLVAGLIAAASFGMELGVWGFGLVLMAAPVLGAVFYAGAALSNAAISGIKRARKGHGNSDEG